MTVTAGVEGLPELLGRLEHARGGITDLSDVNRGLAADLDRQVAPYVPRRTGFLARSVRQVYTPTSWGLVYTAPYAVHVLGFLADATDRAADAQLDQLATSVQAILDA